MHAAASAFFFFTPNGQFINGNEWNDKGCFMGNVTVANHEMAKLDGGLSPDWLRLGLRQTWICFVLVKLRISHHYFIKKTILKIHIFL